MSSALYRAPFHRQLLPVLFLVLFLVLAPIIIFYTSGYRFNPKKGRIERSGTVIINSIPGKAKIFLDAQDTLEKTPVAMQQISPGRHRARLEKNGYHAWEQEIEVHPEQVVFIHRARLWKHSTPELLKSGTILSLASDPDTEKVAALFHAASQTKLSFWGTSRIFGNTELTEAMIASQNSSSTQIIWDAENNVFSLRDKNFQTSISNPIYLVRKNQETHTLEFIHRTQPSKRYLLPPGLWEFIERKNNTLILRDHDRWLMLFPSTNTFDAQIVSGDKPRWNPSMPSTQALLIHGNELWLVTKESGTRVLWRQSEPLQQAIWHPDGEDLFLATSKEIFAMHLSKASPPQTINLQTWNEIQDMVFAGGELFVSGTKDRIKGLWKLTIE